MLVGAARTRVLAIIAAVIGAGVLLALSGIYTQIDLSVYRTGGTTLLHGSDIYAVKAPETGLPFTYPPFSAMLFVPLAVLPWRVAQLLWCALSIWALLKIVQLALGRLPDLRWTPRAVHVMGLVFLLEPIRHGFALGQVNVVVALLVLLDLTPRRHRLLPPGVLIGIAAGIKLTPLIFVPYLFMTGRIKQGVTALAAFAVTIGVGATVNLDQSIHFWTDLVLDPSHVGGVPYVGNQSFTGDVARWIQHTPAGLPWHAFLALVAIIGLIAATVMHRRGTTLHADCMVGLTGLLVSPISWSHHFVWLVPALLALVSAAVRWATTLSAVVFAVVVASPIWWVPNTGNREFGHHGWQLLAAVSYTASTVSVMIGLWLCKPADRRLPRLDSEPAAPALA